MSLRNLTAGVLLAILGSTASQADVASDLAALQKALPMLAGASPSDEDFDTIRLQISLMSGDWYMVPLQDGAYLPLSDTVSKDLCEKNARRVSPVGDLKMRVEQVSATGTGGAITYSYLGLSAFTGMVDETSWREAMYPGGARLASEAQLWKLSVAKAAAPTIFTLSGADLLLELVPGERLVVWARCPDAV